MKTEETHLEINLTALKHNILFLKKRLHATAKFMAVVKASSYGGDAVPIASYIERQHLADYFAVAYTSEGRALRQAGVSLPIVVLHPQPVNFEEITTLKLEPVLYCTRILELFSEYAKSRNLVKYPVHLKCNTGLNRLGFSLDEIAKNLASIAHDNSLKVVSAMSHMAASEDLSEREFTLLQVQKFVKFQEVINENLPNKVMYHMCNTSGILNYPQAQFDMVRSGIGMYGFANDADLQKNLVPIGALKSVISQIHTLKAGDSLGYNRGFIAQETTRTATIPVGHADGLNRIYGKGKGFVFVGGKKAPVLGNVCMDMVMVDVTNIDCKEGDEVIVFDKNHTAEQLAENAGTISYELITSMAHRIKRIYIEE
ncbi:MAG: alanine racemase [Capnocytophaga sp.]|nr:alanine racemase [Capnocytophaga sp.]